MWQPKQHATPMVTIMVVLEPCASSIVVASLAAATNEDPWNMKRAVLFPSYIYFSHQNIIITTPRSFFWALAPMKSLIGFLWVFEMSMLPVQECISFARKLSVRKCSKNSCGSVCHSSLKSDREWLWRNWLLPCTPLKGVSLMTYKSLTKE